MADKFEELRNVLDGDVKVEFTDDPNVIIAHCTDGSAVWRWDGSLWRCTEGHLATDSATATGNDHD